MSTINRTFKLNTGMILPSVGLGTYDVDTTEVDSVIAKAFAAGYRHFDCATVYKNEPQVGAALKKLNVPRDQYLITSKLWNNKHHPDDVAGALENTLNSLQIDEIDLYLIHWPISFRRGDDLIPLDAEGNIIYAPDIDFRDTWRVLEDLVYAGKIKAIGVSNFNKKNLDRLLETARIVPAVNQVEFHPYLKDFDLLDYCKSKGIHVTAWSSLGASGKPALRENPVIVDIAKKHDKSVAQVLLSWAVQNGVSVIPKSSNEQRLKENLDLFVLPQEDMDAINAIPDRGRVAHDVPWNDKVFE